MVLTYTGGSTANEIQQPDNLESHLNPVRVGLVEKEEEYLWSSRGDFMEQERDV